MFSSNKGLRASILASAVGVAAVGATTNASAVMISADASYTIGAVPGSASDSSSIDPSSVDIIASSSGPGGSVFYHTFGNTSGTFGSRVSGDGTFDITSSFTFFNSYENTTGVSQDFFFDFTVIPGSIGTNLFGTAALGAGESLFSSYSLDVMIDYDQDGTFDSTIFNSAASITTTDTGSTLTESGTTLASATYSDGAFGAQYSCAQTIESLFIGSILPSDSFDIQYILTTSANGNAGFGGSAGCEPEFEVDVARNLVLLDEEFGCPSGGAIARVGDPFGPSVASVSSLPTPSASVTEPYTIGLLTAGLAGLLAARRRKVAAA